MWSFISPDKQFSADNEDNVEKAFEASTSGPWKPGDTFRLAISDHGVPGYDGPLSAGMALYANDQGITSKLTNQQLLELIQKHVPANIPVQIIGSQCFSGCVHSLAINRPNTCSISSSNCQEVSVVSKDKNPNPVFSGVYNAIKHPAKFDLDGDGKINMIEAFVASLSPGWFHYNTALGNLSSFAYVTSVLHEDTLANSEISDLSNLNAFTLISGFPGDDLTPSSSRNLNCPDNELLGAQAQALATLLNQITKIMKAQEIPKLKRSDLPEAYGNLYESVIKDWNSKFLTIQAAVQSYDTATAAFVNDWNASPPAARGNKRWKEFEAKFNALKENQNKLEKVLDVTVDARIIQELQRVARFMQTATLTQKKQLEEILKCESVPL